jgi:hypothetical protein
MRSHPVCSRQDTDTTLPFVGVVSQLPLHLPHLINLDVLPFRFNEQDIWMKRVVNFFARRAMIAGVSPFSLSSEAVERLSKLKSHGLLADPFIPQKEVAVHHLLISDGPLQQCNGSLVS